MLSVSGRSRPTSVAPALGAQRLDGVRPGEARAFAVCGYLGSCDVHEVAECWAPYVEAGM